jgi:hypothetical protein
MKISLGFTRAARTGIACFHRAIREASKWLKEKGNQQLRSPCASEAAADLRRWLRAM